MFSRRPLHCYLPASRRESNRASARASPPAPGGHSASAASIGAAVKPATRGGLDFPDAFHLANAGEARNSCGRELCRN